MTVIEIEKEYPNQWVLVAVTKQAPNGDVVAGEILAHDVKREVVYAAMEKVEPKSHVATLFTGQILKKGQSFAF